MTSRRVLALVLALLAPAFALPAAAATYDLEIEKGLAPGPGMGIALLSISLSGFKPNGFQVAYRTVRAPGDTSEAIDADLRVRAALENVIGLWKSDFEDREGQVFALQLPPGSYEFYAYTGKNGNQTFLAQKQFSKRFEVRVGQVLYVGAMTVSLRPSEGVYRVAIIDRYTPDMAAVRRRLPGFETAGLPKNVAPEPGQRIDPVSLAALTAKAEAGDTAAQLDLVSEYLNLESVGFAHAATALPPRDESAARLWLDRAIAAGDPWARYAETLLQSNTLRDLRLSQALFPPLEEGEAHKRFQAAVDSGVSRAMVDLAIGYRKGIAGAEPDLERAKFWNLKFLGSLTEPGGAEYARRTQVPASGKQAQPPARVRVANAPAAKGPSAEEIKRDTVTRLYDPSVVPGLDERGREGYRTWLGKKVPRAFVVAGDGAWYSTWGAPESDPGAPADPAPRALFRCTRAGKPDCKLYAIDTKIVWGTEGAVVPSAPAK